MKVTLDLTKLREDGKITQAEYDKLMALGHSATGSLAFNISIGFGVIAVAAGLMFLVPNALTGVILGFTILGIGLWMYLAKVTQWEVLGRISVLVGALLLGGGVIFLADASIGGFLLIAAGFAAAGVLARSGLLVALAVLALSSAIGARTGYMHATYFLGIEEPAITIALFAILAIGAYLLSKRLTADYERLALIAARTAVFLVNFGFWIGSLWGDEIEKSGIIISDTMFGIAWAVVLLATGIWAAWRNRQWVVNVMAVFGAIHFYTQWFERLGAAPLTVLLGGLLALGFAVALWYFNKQIWRERQNYSQTVS
jgi:hypothetical protein